ncbi:MAG: hypothetical protein KGL10_04290 [Alphaproteobacteria bacterium]|nr:hypothetical protein [Alphaproteobacteria bacterium]
MTALLLSVPLFPFWKVWRRLRDHHPDIWRAAGPFAPRDMLRSPGLVGIFTDVIVKINRDKARQAQDPELARWVRACVELIRLFPRTWGARIGCLAAFGLIVYKLTALVATH